MGYPGCLLHGFVNVIHFISEFGKRMKKLFVKTLISNTNGLTFKTEKNQHVGRQKFPANKSITSYIIIASYVSNADEFLLE